MGVALVADVPDNAVLREAEAAVQRNSQLNHAEIRRQVASVDRYNLDGGISSSESRFTSFGECIAGRILYSPIFLVPL